MHKGMCDSDRFSGNADIADRGACPNFGYKDNWALVFKNMYCNQPVLAMVSDFQVSNIRKTSGGCLGMSTRESAGADTGVCWLCIVYTSLFVLTRYLSQTTRRSISLSVPLKVFFNLSLNNSEQPSSR